jgi:NTE family protein
MKKNQRDTLATCLTQVFGRIEESFVDAAVPLLEWIELAGGEILFEEGDEENGVYFVISGRLRASVAHDGEPRPIGEIARGETVGEMAVLTGEPRSATVAAIRDTVLAHATREVFDDLMRRHPELPIHMARIIITRLKRSATRQRARRPVTVCLLAATDGVDVRAFGRGLADALDRWGVAALETSTLIDERFGAGAAETTARDSEAYHRVTLWLDDVEFWNEHVLLAADGADTEWTRRCLRHADEVLLLARADAPVVLHALEERHLVGEHPITGARQTLVLLHGEDRAHPSDTAAWLDRRPVDAHIHVRPTLPRDIARLARIVSGNAIGLALAGGGARGFAHLGVFKALEEAGVAIDLVAGTSIGAVMAAYISFDLSAQTLIECARRAFARNPTGDINILPLLSLVRGRRLKTAIDRAVVDAVGFDADVVDSWRTLRCVATNFSRAKEHVLARGQAAKCIRASVSIPVALPPVAWKGDLLMDGGVFNNFPTDVLEEMGAGRVIGVDLARERTRQYEHEEVPSSWPLLWDRLRGRKQRRYRLPGLGGILMGTTILYSSSRRQQARQSADIYLNPEFGRIGLLEWKAFDRIVDIGYQHAKEVLSAMSPEELAPYHDEGSSPVGDPGAGSSTSG